MKSVSDKTLSEEGGVAPLVGAWVEITNQLQLCNGFNVAPLVGAWVEIIF